MKIFLGFKEFDMFEKILLASSIAVVIFSNIISGANDLFSIIASIIGVTALVFNAKGLALGKMLVIIFALMYGIVSLTFHYYGEFATYVFMSLPMAVVSLIEWLKHPFKDTNEVEVSTLTKKKICIMFVLGVIVTIIFYFVLNFFNTPNLLFSTLSVITSFAAAYMVACRSPFYAVAYALNDIVLIVLWVLASLENINYLSMVICFVVFLVNDIYGFINWQRMRKRQRN